ncbi:MAG: hypothetical protein QXL86_00005, partial [Candidatus Aenigmatarchaeota archaeon]
MVRDSLNEYLLYILPSIGTEKCAEDLGRIVSLGEKINFLGDTKLHILLPDIKDKLEYILIENYHQMKKLACILITKLSLLLVLYPVFPSVLLFYAASEYLATYVGLYLGIAHKSPEEEEKLELL